MAELLRRLGCEVEHHDRRRRAARSRSTCPRCLDHQADYDLVRRMRASICVLGPLIARCGAADVALPGGDAIGSRGLDMHVAGLRAHGRDVRQRARLPRGQGADGLHGGQIWLDFPSVGATENILMAAVLATGVDRHRQRRARAGDRRHLRRCCTEMGAADRRRRAPRRWSSRASPELHPVEHATVPDRIVAGTWAVAAAITRGDVYDPRRDGRAPRDGAGQAGRRRGRRPACSTTASGSSMDDRPARRRRRDAALPGLPDRPAAAVHRAQRGRRGHGDGHREPVRGAVQVRQRAGAARRRRAHRRPPRGRARPGAAVRGAGRGHRHPRRCRAGARRAGGGGRHDGL